MALHSRPPFAASRRYLPRPEKTSRPLSRSARAAYGPHGLIPTAEVVRLTVSPGPICSSVTKARQANAMRLASLAGQPVVSLVSHPAPHPVLDHLLIARSVTPASSNGGVTAVLRLPPVTAQLQGRRARSGDSEQRSAIVPVTNAAATLVPPSVLAPPATSRPGTASPGRRVTAVRSRFRGPTRASAPSVARHERDNHE